MAHEMTTEKNIDFGHQNHTKSIRNIPLHFVGQATGQLKQTLEQ